MVTPGSRLGHHLRTLHNLPTCCDVNRHAWKLVFYWIYSLTDLAIVSTYFLLPSHDGWIGLTGLMNQVRGKNDRGADEGWSDGQWNSLKPRDSKSEISNFTFVLSVDECSLSLRGIDWPELSPPPDTMTSNDETPCTPPSNLPLTTIRTTLSDRLDKTCSRLTI